MTDSSPSLNTATRPDDVVVPTEDKESKDPFVNPDRTVPPKYNQGIFDWDVWQFVQKEPFLGTVLAQITRTLDPRAPAAGYIGPRKFDRLWTYHTGFCPWRMDMLPQRERWGVFEHELYHLIAGHLTNRMGFDRNYKRLYNIALDLAINSLIHDQPTTRSEAGILPIGRALIPGIVPMGVKTEEEKEFWKALPKLQTSEFYFQLLKDFQKKNQKGDAESYIAFSGVSGIDSHDTWDQIPEEVQELLRQKAAGMIANGVRHADQSNSWGTVPEWMRADLRRMISGEIDWRSVLRWFMGTVRSPDRESTIKRVNRKAPYLFPGAKRSQTRNFVCFIDQSGSMSDDDIGLLFSELGTLSNLAPLDIYHFDTEVDPDSHQTWTRNNAFPKTLRTRCGGTDFNAVANFINDRRVKNQRWSGVIILTDGYAPTMGQIAAGKVLWVITPGGTMEHVRPGDLVIKMTRDRSDGKGAEVKL